MKDTILVLVTIISLVLCAVIYTDNRRLLNEMAKSGDARFESLLEICETVSQVNRRQEAYLRRVYQTREEADERDGKIWGASGSREDRGPGGRGQGVGGP